ncbi:MAG: hypothetical protein ACP5JG_12755 [Anaerolineae bacterium]
MPVGTASEAPALLAAVKEQVVAARVADQLAAFIQAGGEPVSAGAVTAGCLSVV